MAYGQKLFLDMYGLDAQDLIDLNINWVDLYNILQDYKNLLIL